MMNFHFFHGDVAKNRLRSFIRSAGSNLTIFLDPPFGGRMELIHHTIQSIQSILEQEMGRGVSKPKLCWIFPYFMERKLKVISRTDILTSKKNTKYPNKFYWPI